MSGISYEFVCGGGDDCWIDGDEHEDTMTFTPSNINTYSKLCHMNGVMLNSPKSSLKGVKSLIMLMQNGIWVPVIKE